MLDLYWNWAASHPWQNLVEAAKIVAMRNFKRDWGTDNVAKVVEALRQTIPGSASPADAAVKARGLL